MVGDIDQQNQQERRDIITNVNTDLQNSDPIDESVNLESHRPSSNRRE